MKKHWYIMHIEVCPVCGKEKAWRERVYEKPNKYYSIEDRYDWCDVM